MLPWQEPQCLPNPSTDITHPWNRAPPQPIDKRRRCCSIEPLPRIGGVCRCLEVEEAGSSWFSRIGARRVFHGDLPDHCGCQQTGLLGDLSKNRFFQSFA